MMFPAPLAPAAALHSSPWCQCLMIFYIKTLPPVRAVMSAHVNLPTLIALDLKSHLSNFTLFNEPFWGDYIETRPARFKSMSSITPKA